MSLEKRLIPTILLLLAVIFLLIFFIIKPSFYEIEGLSERIEKEQGELEKLYQRGKTLIQVKNELKEIEEKKNLLDGVFFLNKKELEFITILEKIAGKNNISQDILLKDKQSFQDDYNLMPVSLSLRGKFFDLIKYLKELEKSDFYFNINFLNIMALSGKNDQLSVLLEAKTYWEKK